MIKPEALPARPTDRAAAVFSLVVSAIGRNCLLTWERAITGKETFPANERTANQAANGEC